MTDVKPVRLTEEQFSNLSRIVAAEALLRLEEMRHGLPKPGPLRCAFAGCVKPVEWCADHPNTPSRQQVSLLRSELITANEHIAELQNRLKALSPKKS